MDRNRTVNNTQINKHDVALRKESVDRNTSIDNLTQGVFVALRKESVDRNYYCDHDTDWIRGRSP